MGVIPKAQTQRKIITVSNAADSQVKVFGINTNIDKWKPSAKMLPSATTLKTVSNAADKPSAKMLNTKDNKETITKEIKNSSCPGFENPDEEAQNIQPEQPLKKSKKITSSKVITGVIKSDYKTSSKVMDSKGNKDTISKGIKTLPHISVGTDEPKKAQ